ncbi:MAG: helix-turn-helix transcriptional regulator [Polyangiaceae bacterium]
MGTKSSTETVIAILQAFLARRTWGQAELARHVDVGSPALRKRLVELQESGIPLTCDHEHPHAYWSVPKTWFPGGVLLTSEQVIEIFRLLARLRKSASSQKLMERLLAFIPSREATALVSGAVVPVETTEREDRFVPLLEDSAQKKTALLIRYYSQRRGSEEERFVSVHRVLVGPPARFLATCHRSGGLKFFRVENVSEARESLNEAFRDADTKLVYAHIRASIDGFH